MSVLQRLSEMGMRRRLSPLTIECYQSWVGQFLRFCRVDGRWRHPRELRGGDVGAFLTHLARDRRAAAATQNQAMCAIVFLYKQVLGEELGPDHLGQIAGERSTRPVRVPTVLSVHEVGRIVAALAPGSVRRAMVELLYGAGLRITECCTLRLRDLDFDRQQLIVRGGKGDKDRIVMLPAALRGRLVEQARHVRHQHDRDSARGGGFAPVPNAVANKIDYAERDWRWQYLFPSRLLRRDDAGRGYRWHADPSALDRAIRAAVRRSGVAKRVSAHTFRHSFATHLLEAGYDVRQVQTLLGHAKLETTMIYTHVMNKPATAVTSPLDRLLTV
ncbi:MAG TPA: integron integrase [Tepidisphaeraceae bacterium]|jgi:integron integrase